MRDPERLDDFYKKIRKLHQKYVPDWRFGQLIMNWQQSLYINNNILCNNTINVITLLK